MDQKAIVCETIWDFIDCIANANLKGRWNLLRSESDDNSIFRLDEGGEISWTASTQIVTFGNESLHIRDNWSTYIRPRKELNVTFKPDEENPDLICDKIYLGGYDAAKNLAGLQNLGITHILSVTSEHDPRYPDKFTYNVISIDDKSTSNLLKHLDNAIEFIEKSLQTGAILIHCSAGKSRSPSVVIAWLMYSKHLNYQQAFNFVHRRWIYPNTGFRNQLKIFEEQLKAKIL